MSDHCRICGTPTPGRRADAQYCSDRCRKRDARSRDPIASEPLTGSNDVETATLAELQAAGRAETTLGAVALALAAQMDRASGPGLASLAKELRATLAEALAGEPAAPDKLDELIARRRARFAEL